MDIYNHDLPLDLPSTENSIIKVIGVGGGGQNAVNHMYRKGIKDVTFVVCNTDKQVLNSSPVPVKLQLGGKLTEGLGAGGKPEIGRAAAEESLDEFRKILSDNTKMVFITTGMGGGTGTGAAPVLAKAAHDMGMLTIGIVTIPFQLEGAKRIKNAMEGVLEFSNYVDALLVINNEKLRYIYPDLDLNIKEGFAKADDVLANSAKGIAEIITVEGYINVDFADVRNIMKDGRLALMNTGTASGANRISKAIENALESPLLNTNRVNGAKKVLFAMYCSESNMVKMSEIGEIHAFIEKVGTDIEVAWGVFFDDTLNDEVKVTVIATGYEVGDIPGMPKESIIKIKREEPQQPAFKSKTFGDFFGKDLTLDENADEKLAENVDNSPENMAQKLQNTYYSVENMKAQPAPKPDAPRDDVQFDVTLPKDDDSESETETENSLEYGRVATSDEISNDEKLKNIEKIPAWKRKFGFK